MRCRSAIVAAAIALVACSSDPDGSDDDGFDRDAGDQDSGNAGTGGNAGSGGSGGEAGDGGIAGSAGSDGGSWDGGAIRACAPEAPPAPPPSITEPLRLVSGTGVPLGTTPSGYMLYRDNNRVYARGLAAAAQPVEIGSGAGTTLIRGNTVFHLTSIDYGEGRADINVWTGGTCVRSLGRGVNAEDAVAASDDGAYLLYSTNVTATTYDVVVANRDFSSQELLATVGKAAPDTTCRARYGFAGPRIVVASCTPGNQRAELKVYEQQSGAWTAKTITSEASGIWHADSTGQNLAYTSFASALFHWRATDTGAGQSVDPDPVRLISVKPNGDSIFYSIGSKLYRAATGNPQNPVHIANTFRDAVSFSPDYGYMLYSSFVTYEGGEDRDLRLSGTSAIEAPLVLAANKARVSRSAFTDDSRYALYLTGLSAQGSGELHVRTLGSGSERTFPNVDTVIATGGSTIAFTSERDTTLAPVTANLSFLDAAGAVAPTTLPVKITDGRNVYVTADKRFVIYARPRLGSDATTDGIWLDPL